MSLAKRSVGSRMTCILLNIEIKSHRFCKVYFSLFDYSKSRMVLLSHSFIYYYNLFIYYYDLVIFFIYPFISIIIFIIILHVTVYSHHILFDM